MGKKIYVGCDSAAVELKELAKKVFAEYNYEIIDLGVNSASDQTMYPEVAHRVCTAMQNDKTACEGALFCGTGIGMSISANKHKGIYAGVAHDNYAVERLRLSNNANVICMGARIIGPELAKKILREWCQLEFKDGSSTSKVNLIKEYENEFYK